MSNFKLSESIDNNKIFLVKRSELEGRLDPHQYHHERLAAIKALNIHNKTILLCHAVINAKEIKNNISKEDIYIGLENITSQTGEYIETSNKESISSAGIFKKRQILFPKLRPYLNKVHIAEFDGICSTEFHIFEVKDLFIPEFLAIYLRSDLIV